MLLREPIEEINQRLLNNFGRSIDDGRPHYRVVWSEDQYEKRLTEYNDKGNMLIFPEVRLVPKYKQYIRQKYILERLTVIPFGSDILEKVAYEPIWTFADRKGNYLPPFFDGCKFIIEYILTNVGKARTQGVKYKDDISKEKYIQDVEKMKNELFGNETDITDALAYGSGVALDSTKTFKGE